VFCFAKREDAETFRERFGGKRLSSDQAMTGLAMPACASVTAQALYSERCHSRQLVRVVVRYLEARPQRLHEPFAEFALDALFDAWPSCPG
jgi:Rap1a immunity proteins